MLLVRGASAGRPLPARVWAPTELPRSGVGLPADAPFGRQGHCGGGGRGVEPASAPAKDADVDHDAAAALMPQAAPLADIAVPAGCPARPNRSCAPQAAISAAVVGGMVVIGWTGVRYGWAPVYAGYAGTV